MDKICPTCKGDYERGEVFCPLDGARLITASQTQAEPENQDPLVGATFDKYLVKRRIGEGGMGLVYEAMHTVIEKRVALKVLRDDFSSREEVVERFRQEAKSASRIGHQHIVDISDFGSTPTGQSYFVMEFLEGEDLANVLAREVVISMERAVDILVQCCRALGAAHAKGIVHRDMKPENIFLIERNNSTDFVKIVDFGIAKMSDIETPGAPGRKLTKTGMIFGTPEYMSPEQASGKELDHRVDIYALGVILFECLTGRVPFVGDTFMGILTQHTFNEPPPLREVNANVRCTQELELVLAKALSKAADQRYQTMEELAEAMTEALEGRVTAPTLHGYGQAASAPATAAPRVAALSIGPDISAPAPPASSKAPLIAAIVAALILLVGVGVYFGTQRNEEAPVATTTPEADETNEPEVGRIRIVTVPTDGAAVIVENGPGCGATPCEIEAPSGESLDILARTADAQGTIRVEVQAGSQTVQIALVANEEESADPPAVAAAPTSEMRPRRRNTMRASSNETAMVETAMVTPPSEMVSPSDAVQRVRAQSQRVEPTSAMGLPSDIDSSMTGMASDLRGVGLFE